MADGISMGSKPARQRQSPPAQSASGRAKGRGDGDRNLALVATCLGLPRVAASAHQRWGNYGDRRRCSRPVPRPSPDPASPERSGRSWWFGRGSGARPWLDGLPTWLALAYRPGFRGGDPALDLVTGGFSVDADAVP